MIKKLQNQGWEMHNLKKNYTSFSIHRAYTNGYIKFYMPHLKKYTWKNNGQNGWPKF